MGFRMAFRQQKMRLRSWEISKGIASLSCAYSFVGQISGKTHFVVDQHFPYKAFW